MENPALRALGAALLDLLLPTSCGGCDAPGSGWCVACAASLGPPLRPTLLGGPPVLAVGRYRGPLRRALLAYKERGRRDLAVPLASLLGAALVAARPPPLEPWWWLVPAPSRPAAARARGGDHVLRLCRQLARGDAQLSVAPALRLARGVQDSVGLSPVQRAANLAGRVRVRRDLLPPPGAPVLLVDDVVTTGATVHACWRALGATRQDVVAVLVLADATSGRNAKAYPCRGRENS
ncbi:MAG: phosphoribosyltransferase [Pseudonocardia sp.]|jgi:predicted amidophosphoribosyltransferase|nr:phosphoribosyltransferase [Pseudonocardia sp.]